MRNIRQKSLFFCCLRITNRTDENAKKRATCDLIKEANGTTANNKTQDTLFEMVVEKIKAAGKKKKIN